MHIIVAKTSIQPTADDIQPTADDIQPTADDIQPTVDDIHTSCDDMPLLSQRIKNSKSYDLEFLVEMAVIETASENPLPQLSTSVSALLGFPSGNADRQALPYGSL